MKAKLLGLIGVILLYTHTTYAVVDIDITRGKVEPMPIAISLFKGDEEMSREIGNKLTTVIINNLENSGLFRIIDKAAFLEEAKIGIIPTFANWRKINATSLVLGSVNMMDVNKISIQFKIWDPYNEKQTEAAQFTVNKNGWRRVGHKIADIIYKRLTGEEGYFDTRVLFMTESGPYNKRVKKLSIMDQDGAGVRYLTDGKDLIITPRFDPNHQRIIYMSYKNLIPKVYILNLETGVQKLIGDYPGISFAPRFSPNSNHAIISIAKGGTTNVYEIDLKNSFIKQITFDQGVINTSPSYSPDGSKITFNSDRGGSMQLYVMNRDGSAIKRISYGGGGYATPVWSPRGDYIAFTKMQNSRFYIGVMRPDGAGERLLTSSWLDEGPTWSPNGRILMFERKKRGGKNQIYSVDITGFNERLISTPGEASDPAWSPLLK